jgi:hypothetical protein
MDASSELSRLQAARDKAVARVADLELRHREAVAAVHQASSDLAEAERVGVSAARRHGMETKLAEARSVAGQPWAERISGARSAVRDADQAIRHFIGGNLRPLVETLEADGRVATERENAAFAELVAAWSEREGIAGALSQLAVKVAAVSPGDVSYSAASEVVRAVTALLNTGGEVAPTLSRTREPWATILAGTSESEPA